MRSPLQCIVKGCKKSIFRKKWCAAHYSRWVRHGNPLGGGPEKPRKQKGQICQIKNCEKPAQSREWCVAHYTRWLRHGSPIGGGTSSGVPKKFLEEKVLNYEENKCLKWPYRRCAGYGALTENGKTILVSRIICEHFYGPPPTSKHEAAHLCGKGNEGCVSKKHLKWKTHSENEADKIIHGTHNRGERHPLSKLTNKDVKKIQFLKGKMLQKDIAKMFYVSSPVISNIHSGKSYR